jgi:competence CoiA-like predicted nuclease
MEAFPKGRGTCRACHGPATAKCGRFVGWHWAHKALDTCDRWAERETAWHRNWKNKFPAAWQEVDLYDEALTECHIADVKTEAGVVLEFQRSTIHPDDVQARERFYQRMVWVIDGSRNEFDRINFNMMRSHPNSDGLVKFIWYPRSKLFHRWHTTTPVFIDFGADFGFWRILRFNPETREGVAALYAIDAFVDLMCAGTTDFSFNGGPASLGN